MSVRDSFVFECSTLSPMNRDHIAVVLDYVAVILGHIAVILDAEQKVRSGNHLVKPSLYAL